MKKLLLVLFFMGLLYAGWALVSKKSSPSLPSGASQKQEEIKSLADYFSKKIPFNFLLLGYGGGAHEGTHLTDSMILAHVRPADKTVTLISIPRDAWVKIPTRGQDGGYWKINAAYALGLDDRGYPSKADQYKGANGGGNLAKYAVEQVTGLPIARYAALDFSGFKKAIDFLGGIDVKVERTFDDFEYPVDGRETSLCGHAPEELPELEKIATVSAVRAFPCRYEHLHFDAGVTRMDGATALKFVRSRHSAQDGSDFGRAIRQKNVILAARQKALSLGSLPKIPGFIQTLSSSLSTDVDASDIKDLLLQSSSVNDYEIKSLALTTDNFLKVNFSPDGQYILTSREGVGEWQTLQAGIKAFLDPESRLSSPLFQIVNASGTPALTDTAAAALKASGFSAISFGAFTGKSSLAKTQITVLNSKIDAKILRQVQNVFATSNLINKEADGESYDILVTLGKDFTGK